MSHSAIDRAMASAVRLALRGHGRVEPNPMVGCVILDRDSSVVGWGFHRAVGGDHAEVDALRRAGARARGGTLVVTLEPCAHQGRTPPCTDAIERAGVARVVFATADPNPVAAGGAARLRERGIVVEHRSHPLAARLNEPFVLRITTGLPWITAKWAQTIDGAIAARGGESRWISSDRLRRMGHRERGRVDAIVTGMGTVVRDDPRLTPRDVSRRRMPLRVVVDPELAIDPARALVRSACAGAPVLIAARGDAIRERSDRAAQIMALGRDGLSVVDWIAADGSLRPLFERLARERGASRVLVESGGGLLGALEREGLVHESWVVVAPLVAGDALAPRAVRGFEPAAPAAMIGKRLVGAWRRGDEMLLLYRKVADGSP